MVSQPRVFALVFEGAWYKQFAQEAVATESAGCCVGLGVLLTAPQPGWQEVAKQREAVRILPFQENVGLPEGRQAWPKATTTLRQLCM